jgi:hypothetical protein
VSSKHLEFTWSNGDWFALDMGSSNGTRLNESQVPMMAGATNSYALLLRTVSILAQLRCVPHLASR